MRKGYLFSAIALATGYAHNEYCMDAATLGIATTNQIVMTTYNTEQNSPSTETTLDKENQTVTNLTELPIKLLDKQPEKTNEPSKKTEATSESPTSQEKASQQTATPTL